MNENVYIIRFINGEEVIAKLDVPDSVDCLRELGSGEFVKLVNPHQIGVDPGTGKLAISKYLPYAQSKDLEVARSSIQFIAIGNANISGPYNQVTTGLSVATPQEKRIITGR